MIWGLTPVHMNQCHYKPLSELAAAKLLHCTRGIMPGAPITAGTWCLVIPWRGKPRATVYTPAFTIPASSSASIQSCSERVLRHYP